MELMGSYEDSALSLLQENLVLGWGCGREGSGGAVPDLRLDSRSSKQWIDSIFLIFTDGFDTGWT